MRHYSTDPPDDPCDRPDDWEGELPCEVVPHADVAFARMVVEQLDEPGVWWADPLEMGDLSEPFDEAAE